MAKVLVDADTGDEIIYFVRRGKSYLYLRDKVTKRFIARLSSVEIRAFKVVNYSVSEAKKGNPLYLDAVVTTNITSEEFRKLDEVEDNLDKATDSVVSRYFGKAVVEYLLELSGFEYGSKSMNPEEYGNAKGHYGLVWKHHLADKPRKAEGDTWL
jgi:hypothetical protein